MHVQNEKRRKIDLNEASEGRTSIDNIEEAEQASTDYKQHMNSLADKLEIFGDASAFEDVKAATRSWGQMHRQLVKEREEAEETWA